MRPYCKKGSRIFGHCSPKSYTAMLLEVILFVNAAPNYVFFHYLSHFVYRRTSTEINMYVIGLISLTLIKMRKVKLMTHDNK